ncbi:hypothetical protein [Stenotrophomonas sp.]|uniref:hypothetical protein n=1 Tax=Stenotrophomonas sp. TaxID=69392 RepID=UPI002D48E56B|nr:hypothetical protein [Stenotrophomonas sp.]HYQ25131.1 hypothetical protein [Stenotrophomonas sp.]
MAKKWVEVAASPAYQALAPEQQEEARNQYWNEVVAPNVPQAEHAYVRQAFDSDTSRTVNWPGQAPLEAEIVGGTRQSATQQAAPAQQQPQTAPDGWEYGPLRDTMFGARSVLQGLGGLIGAVGGDAGNYALVNPILRAVGAQQVRPYREEFGALADQLGLPKAQTSGDRVLGDIGEALTGTGLTLGAGAGLNALANMGRGAAIRTPGYVAPVENRLANFLTAQPGLQTVSAATGSGASSISRESGGSQGNQLLAGLAGGLGPGLVTAGGAAGLRGVVRGGSGENMKNRLADFNALGAQPSVGQASGNPMVQGLENLLAQGPTSSGVMARAAERQSGEISSGLGKMANDFSRSASGERAGRAIKRGIYDEGGFSSQFKATQDQLYDKVDELIPPAQGVAMGNTRATLDSLSNPIKSPGAPNTARLFQNGRITGIGNAVEADLAIPTPQQLSLDEAVAKVNQLYASRDSASQDAGRFAAFANDQANAAQRYFPVAGQPRFPGRYTPAQANVAPGQQAAAEATEIARDRVSQAAEIEATIGDLTAAAERAGGRLPYEAVKKLRSLVGEELQDAGLASDFPRSKFKALYAALSEDLGVAAQEAGPEAVAAYSRANAYTRAGMRRIEDIESVIDRAGGAEKVFSSLMATGKEGGSTLRSVLQSLPVESQRAVTAAAIKRLGRASPGAQDATGEVFSARTFLTNWNNVSTEARRALFDRYGKGFSEQVDRIAKVADMIDKGAGVFKNPPGTAKSLAGLTYGASLVGSMFTGGTALLLGAGVSANAAARWLTNPRAVKFLANATTLPKSQIPSFINYVAQEGQKTGDQDLQDLAKVLGNAEQEVANSSDNRNDTDNRR